MFVIALNSMLTLFVFMLVGYICSKKNIFNSVTIENFNKLLLNVTAPAMFISAMNITIEKSILKPSVQSAIYGFAFHILALVIAFIVVKVFKVKAKSIWLFTLTFANIGFLGFPLINDLFGTQALFFTSLINISFYVLIFSVGVVIMTLEVENNLSFKKLLFNKAFIGTLIGLVVFLIPYSLPVFISKSIYMIGQITPPLSMIVVGSIFASTSVISALKKPEIYALALIKLIVIPIAIYFSFSLLIDNKQLVQIFTILSATPSAVLGVVLAKEYKNNDIYVCEIVFVTTILSVVTLPTITYIIM